jgi:hypothetical protein
MLIVNLLGGLGNQMFQYAFGQALSARLQKPVKYSVHQLLDRPADASHTFRNYELDIFNASINIATNSELQLFGLMPATKVSALGYKVYRRIVKVRRFVEKNDFGYDESVFQQAGYVYYDGYWQNENYFKPYQELLRAQLQLRNPLSGDNLAIANHIKTAPVPVSLHVRRGDYISNANANRAHGICSPEYYEKAVELLQARLGAIQLFIFSDEPDWVQDNMNFEGPATYVSHNTGKASAEDMRLMSLCQHNIIANSSFSWWGAWLNQNPNKLVIAPKQWMQLTQGNHTSPVPATWLSL